MRPIRVCFIISGLGLGGAEHVLLRLLRALDRTSIEPLLVVLGADDALADEFARAGVVPHMVGLTRRRLQLMDMFRLMSLIRGLSPDLLQGWMYHGNFAASFFGARLGVPVCWSIHDTPDAAHGLSTTTRWIVKLSRWYVGRVATIFNVSARSAAYCCATMGWPADRTEVLPNGLDVSKFRPGAARRAAWRLALGVNDSIPLIGMVARWSPVKNHRLFLEAAATLVKSGNPGRFVMVGKGLDSDNSVLSGWIDELDLGARVVLLGPRHDLEEIYPAFDLVALTSKSEGFPLALTEAMACGVPVVSTDVGDASEIIGEAGRVVPASAEAFAAAFAELLGAPKLAELGVAARARIVDRYAIEGIAARLAARYVALAAGRT
ncbi:glycosyltransferase [Niveibacterium sp. 24ML]|uniref:glycosyltransferase n=1 Tax=Niveibacterium sp. 24ML TaxID=2985512 RepID=UPI0022721424|nr:glycosyltransferase [Niveibacterium sp. 24ML]MCX9154894.1 glycosyltransferase [Niveibacterium sp. 24ML]